MLTKFLQSVVLGLCVVTLFPVSNRANAVTPLTKAEIQEIRNIVQFIPKNNSQIRPARKSQTITPGDGISTGRSSLADLRFNDGSVARVGEQAVFQFLPQTRNFTLTNGTVLLLIPPGRGQTNIKTPNAAAAIRGSALFVKHNSESNTTIIGALTNSGIQVANQEASQELTLKAGQLMVVVEGKFQGLYDFDLRTFYQQSSLVKGLNLNRQNSLPTSDPSIASVQAETTEALETQLPILGEGTIENPSFLSEDFNPTASANPSNNNSNSRNNGRNNSNNTSNNRDFGRSQRLINGRGGNNFRGNSPGGNFGRPLDVLIRTGEVIRENRQRNNSNQGQGNQGQGNQGQGNQGQGNQGQGNQGQGNQGQGNQGQGNQGQGNQGQGNQGQGNQGQGNQGQGNQGQGNQGQGNQGQGNQGQGNQGQGNQGQGNQGQGNQGQGNQGQGNQGQGNQGQGNQGQGNQGQGNQGQGNQGQGNQGQGNQGQGNQGQGNQGNNP
ncbi:FecR domain-containing protein [Okeanomitos corallinicola TIOX110]|uniref:FecR domain-containing protein n=1 Tax=Okeanomitos corallinicola TIOX110 TaxID=3133117 RepID=A0ABZ2USM0_9CYAN